RAGVALCQAPARCRDRGVVTDARAAPAPGTREPLDHTPRRLAAWCRGRPRSQRGGRMSRLRFTISMSLDGYVAGPDQTREEPLGRGGERLHDWVVRLRSWRESHGRERGAEGVDDEILRESTA